MRRLLISGLFIAGFGLLFSCKPKEDVQLRSIRDVIVDATGDPMLRANAILYNPNKVKMKLRKINIKVFVDGRQSADIDQRLDMKIPSQAEFKVPLEVKLNMKEMGFMDAVFKVIGGKKFKIRYKGSISITYKGLPIRVPVDYEDEVNLRF